MQDAERSHELPVPGRPASRAPRSLRSAAIVLHRYVGLILASFLLVCGVTGTALAFRHELEAAISPELFRAEPPGPDAELLEPIELRERLLAQLPPGSAVTWVPLAQREGETMVFFADVPAHGGEPDDEFFVDPYTGELLGSRRWGDLGQGAKNIVPFVYRLHFGLALGDAGMYLLGVVALLWTLDCFVGAYLTLPPRRARRQRKPVRRRDARAWLGRWASSWLLNTTKTFSLVFTWHRASGLWIWGMLLVFAWSAVALNLREVYNPVMTAAFGMEERPYDRLPKLPVPREEPALDWDEALEAARARAAEEGERRGFQVLSEYGMDYYADRGLYRYWVRTTLDVADTYPRTKLWMDGDTGALVAFVAPTGDSAGQTITTWLVSLHFGSVAGAGLAYRIFVALVGLAVALLSVTGVWIWWRKRGLRRRRAARPPAARRRSRRPGARWPARRRGSGRG